MNILVLGAGGQVGRELVTTLTPLGTVIAITRDDCDLSDFPRLTSLLNHHSPAIVVNAAAYTAVDKAESEPEQAMLINAAVPALLADWCRDRDALLVDFATDYIFDGGKAEPWRETDPRAPLNTYGRSKLAGLAAIEQSGCRHLVFIVTWIYARQGKNFPATMLRLAAERSELSVVADQFGAPTPADWIARQMALCIPQVLRQPAKAGLYNLAPAGSASWHQFAQEIIRLAREAGVKLKASPAAVKPVATAEYPTPARRPANSRLDTGKLTAAFAITPPDWLTLYRERAADIGNRRDNQGN